MASKRNSRKPAADISAARASSPRQFVTWTPQMVRGAIRQAEAGQLELAAACCAWLQQDAKLVAALNARVDQLMGLPVQFQSADKANPQALIDDLTDDFSEAYPEEELSQILFWGLLLGYAPARHQPEAGTSGRTLPKLTFWNPGSVNYDIQANVWRTRDVTQQDLVITPNDGTWALFTPYGKDRPWASGLWYSLALLAVAKCYAIQDWAKTSEKASLWVFESGLVDKDGYPITTTKEQRQQLVDALDARGSDASIALPSGWELKLVQTADSYHIYREQIDMIDQAFAILIRGGNLTTQVKTGSMAATETQGELGDGAKTKKDSSTLGTFLRTQSLNWWASWNYGPGALAPWPKWEKKAPKTIDAAAATAITTFASAGFEVDIEKLKEDYGFDFLVSYKRPAPPPSPFGGGGFGDEEEDPEEDPKAKKPLKAHMHHTIHAQDNALPGQRYIDRLQQSVINTAPLAASNEELLKVVRSASSAEDLTNKLTAAYAEIDQTELALVFEQAFILAELAGRYAVLSNV